MAEPNYRDIAQQIVNIVGKDNIISATHCATRLRLIVKDKDVIDGKALEKVPLVKGTFFNAGQYQIILGTGIVNKVFGEMSAIGLSTLSKAEQDAAVKAQQKGIKRLMRTLGDIFVPIIPIIAATGLFLGLNGCLFNDNVLALFGVTTAIIPEYVATLVNVLTETVYLFPASFPKFGVICPSLWRYGNHVFQRALQFPILDPHCIQEQAQRIIQPRLFLCVVTHGVLWMGFPDSIHKFGLTDQPGANQS